MASTINAVNIAIRADTGLARNEIKTLHALLKSSIDPVRQLDAQMELLEKAYKDGAIEQINYMEAKSKIIAGLKKEEEAAREAAQEYLRLKEAQEPVFMAQEVVKKADVVNSKLQSMVTYVAALGVAGKTIDEFVNAFQRVDDLADTAAGLNTEYNKLKTFAASLAEIGGISFDQAISGIKNLNAQIGQASLGVGKNVKLFEQLGIDPKTLAELDVAEQFGAIASSIEQLGNNAERAAVASRLFGDANVAAAMSGYYQKIKDTNEEMQRWAVPLTETEIARLSKANDIFERLKITVSSLKDKYAAIAVSDFGAKMLGSISSYFKPLEAYSFIVSNFGGDIQKVDNSIQKTKSQIEILREQQEVTKEIVAEERKQDKPEKLQKQNDSMRQYNAMLREQASIEKKMLDIKQEGFNKIEDLRRTAAAKAAASMSGPAFAPLVQAETKQAFDFEVKRQQDNSKILEDQRELQRRIAAASEDTAKKIANLKPMRAAR